MAAKKREFSAGKPQCSERQEVTSGSGGRRNGPPYDSLANAFRTSDRDSPNCRAIREGVTPALKAARTAFS